MQPIILLVISFVFIVIEFRQKILKNIKTIKKNNGNIENTEYYREKIQDYSPLIYAKLLNKKINNSDVIISMLLYLEEKNIIDIDEENNIIVKNDKNIKKHEKFFIKHMKFIFADLYHNTKTKYNSNYTIIRYLDRLIYEDMVSEGLIEIENKKGTLINFIQGKEYVYIVDVLPLFYDMMAIPILAKSINNFMPYCIFWTTIFISLFINCVSLYFNFYLEGIKTRKSHECIEKIKAQKRLLKNYTLISDKTVEDKMIWEYYIRSAILLDLKGNLDNEATRFYKEILDKYKCRDLGKIDKDLIFIGWMNFILLLPWMLLFWAGNNIVKTILSAFIVIPIVYMYLINRIKK